MLACRNSPRSASLLVSGTHLLCPSHHPHSRFATILAPVATLLRTTNDREDRYAAIPT